MSLSVSLTPEAKALIDQFPDRTHAALDAIRDELDHQNDQTVGYANLNKMSGPRPGVLGVVSGNLRRSVRRNDATVSGATVTGAVGSNSKYAGVHEYGFDGDVQVRGFVRRQRSRDVRVKRKIVGQGIAFVRAFTRHMRMPARSFIGSSIEERLPQYEAGLSRAIVTALGGAA